MTKIIKSIAQVFILLIIITFFSFLLTYLSLGDPARILLGKSGVPVSQEVVDAKREELGLNEPMLVQYKNWLVHFAKGDMGISYKSNKPVSELVKTAMPNTLLLTSVSMLLTFCISIPAGIFCAYKKDKVFDKAVRMITYLFASLPSFFLALIFMYIFSLKLKLLPAVGGVSFKGIIMPTLVLALTLSAWFTRQVRSIFLNQLEKDYVTGLRSRGIGEKSILFKHILKNAFAPLITLFGMSFGTMLGGSTIVESIFSWNGMGKLAVDAISARDYPVIQAFVVWMAIVFLLVNFIADLLCRCVDPRIGKEWSAMQND